MAPESPRKPSGDTGAGSVQSPPGGRFTMPTLLCLTLLGAWAVIGFVGLLRPGDVRLVARVLFPLGSFVGAALALVALVSAGQPPDLLVLPLGLPAIASLAIFQVLFVWNDLLIGLTLAQENQPIAPTIAQQLRRFGSNLDVIAPASFFSAIIPLTIFAMFQRYFVQGIVMSGIKG